MRKWYSLIDKVWLPSHLKIAFKQVKRNTGSRTPGVDGMNIFDYRVNLEQNLEDLSEELKSGSYQPQAVRRIYIDKADGSKRGLGIPTIKDRIVQQSLLNVLQPIFDPTFHPSSYGYRPNRSAHQALSKAEQFSRRYGLSHVVDMDLSRCFDTLDHKLILKSLNQKVSDGKILLLVEKFLKSGVLEGGVFSPTEKGSPQGGIISPLLMNIYLDNFDQYMKSEGIRIVRYADDILIFADSKSKAGEYRSKAEKYLESNLKLTVNRRKSHLTNLTLGIKYLGFVIKSHGVVINPEKVIHFKEKVRHLTPRNKGKSIYYFIKKLNELLRGFSAYFKVGLMKKQFSELMSWTRRRLRMMIMVSWKSWKPLHKRLRQLGIKGEFERISMSRWRNSCSPLIHIALSNKWFSENGLFNMERVVTNTLHQYAE